MSDVIRLLPDSVANQIAAGEVIQRPASIIKELVENAIDAGATRVQVIVTDAGKSCVQVIDNGKGMSCTDARLSFERHATSKITAADDLFALTTMGFRGEALASIAAVAQVELRTRMAEEELGTTIRIEGSKFVSQAAIACPVGANFTVSNLFYNVPARRKFLKSNTTELTNIITEFERIALAHPDLSFSLATPDATLLDLPASKFKERIANIFGRKLEKKLLSIQVETEVVSIVGFVGKPESSKKKGAQQYFFANGRFMRHPYFAKAIQTAFERLIPEGEQVPFFLQLVVNPARIDVNIHPTKTEIKFEDEAAIWQILLAAIREALGRFNASPTIDFDQEGREVFPVFDATAELRVPSLGVDEHYNPFAEISAAGLHEFAPTFSPTFDPSTAWGGAAELAADLPESSPTVSSAKTALTERSVHSSNVSPRSQAATAADLVYGDTSSLSIGTASVSGSDAFVAHTVPDFPQDPYIALASVGSETSSVATGVATSAVLPTVAGVGEGEASSEASIFADTEQAFALDVQQFLQYKGRYLILPKSDGLLIVDQRRAHIRVLFDEYMARIMAQQQEAQRLLFPQLLELSPSQSALLQAVEGELSDVGFELSYLGGGSFSILSLPADVDDQDAVQLLHKIIDDMTTKQTAVREEILSTVALTLARRSAVTAGEVLNQSEVQSLLTALFACATPTFTPDGKPIMSTLPHAALLRSFA